MSGAESKNSTDFATTRWSLILSSLDPQAPEGKAREALAQLCRVYWRPVFAYVCREGHPVADAEDLTQDFFVNVLQGNLLELAERARGRFRALLLTSLRNFLNDSYDRRSSKKRGGKLEFISWDDLSAESPSLLSIPLSAYDAWPPEKIFDVRWAATLAEQALRRLREECESRGRRRVFDTLSVTLTADRSEISYTDLACELGVTETQLKRLLHQLRERFRQLLRAEVAGTLDNPDQIDEELRYLCSALALAGENQTV